MKNFFLMFLVVLLLTPFVVAAQSVPCTSGTATGDIGRCVSQIYIWSLGISGILAVVMVVLGGYMIMTARGNGAQAAKGRTFLTSALAGLVLLLGAYLILNTINSDLTNFSISSWDQLKTPKEKGVTPPPAVNPFMPSQTPGPAPINNQIDPNQDNL
ncbi:MAG: hypothetical protein KW793_04525 [Candidatus Doudnabacteria bacterium]|nr:hypothetical protein [Candidatus Doudnabacteria bacterium]